MTAPVRRAWRMFTPSLQRSGLKGGISPAKMRDIAETTLQMQMRRRYHFSHSSARGGSPGSSGKHYRTWITPSDDATELTVIMYLVGDGSETSESVRVNSEGSYQYIPSNSVSGRGSIYAIRYDLTPLALDPGEEMELWLQMTSGITEMLMGITVYDTPDSEIDDSHDYWVEVPRIAAGKVLTATDLVATNQSVTKLMADRGIEAVGHTVPIESDVDVLLCEGASLGGVWSNAIDEAAAGFVRGSSAGFPFKVGAAWADSPVPIRVRIWATSLTGDFEVRIAGAYETTVAQTVSGSVTEYTFDTYVAAQSDYRADYYDQIDIEVRDVTGTDLLYIRNIIIEQRRGSTPATKPLFKTCTFNGGFNLPSVNRIPIPLTFDSLQVWPDFVYRGVDASATTLAALEGTDLAVTAGTAPTVGAGAPGHDAEDVSFTCTDAYYAAASSAYAEIGANDFVQRYGFRMSSDAGAVLAQKYDSTYGWVLKTNGSDQLVLYLYGDGGDATVTSAALVPGQWYFLSVVYDASGSCQLYVNWEASGSAVAVSGVGDITSNAALRIGSDGTTPWGDGRILYMSQHSSGDWLDTHSQLDWQKEQVMRWRGVWPQFATGTALLQEDPRASAGYEQKLESGVHKYYRMGPGLPRVWEVEEGVYKLWCEQEETQAARDSDGLTSGWTAVNLTSRLPSTTEAGPFDDHAPLELISNTTTGSHGAYAQTTASPSASGEVVSLRCRFKAGSHEWVGFRCSHNSTFFGKFFHLSGSGTVGSNFNSAPSASSIASIGDGWYEIFIQFTSTAASSILTQFYIGTADGALSHAGDGSTVEMYYAGLDCRIDSDYCGSHIVAPLVSPVTREPDVIRYKADDGNVSATSGELMARCRTWIDGQKDSGRSILSISDGGVVTDQMEMQIAISSDVPTCDTTASGGDTGSTIGTTSIVDGDSHMIQLNIEHNSLRMAVDGAFEGTEDTAVDLPDDLDRIDVGAAVGGDEQINGGVSDIEIYENNLRKVL